MNRWGRAGQRPVTRALHVVYGAMVAHATEQGASPLSAVNVERLVSAIRLLRDRRVHEAAPFVSSWRPVIEDVDEHPLEVTDAELREHLALDPSFKFRADGLAEKIASIARSTSAAGDGTTFLELEELLIRRICSLLSTPTDVSYLSPLMDLAKEQEGGLDITTLNYDRTVEIAAQECAVEVDTGFGRWKPGLPLVFSSTRGRINLFKPHGSIDWERRRSSTRNRLEGHPLVQYAYSTGVTPQLHPMRGEQSSPLIVIGDREKLGTDGPTLALLRAFEESLYRASHLLVVGYSFSDEHVNTVVRNWMNADSLRTVGIVDPGWSTPRMVISPDTKMSFKDALVYTAGLSLKVVPGRIVVVTKGAKDGLAEAIRARPLGKVDSLVDVSVNLEDNPSITITNRGYAIDSIEVRAWPSWAGNPLQVTAVLRDENADSWVGSLKLPDLSPGESHVVAFDPTQDRAPEEIEIRASSWAYTVNERVRVKHDNAESDSARS